MPPEIHLNLDGACDGMTPELPELDARSWGPRLRFIAPAKEIERFAGTFLPQLPPFILYGSGDFHHLTAVFLRRFAGPLTVVCFDNHPDWDIRPPRWSCGGWVNRALELPQVKRVSVWGCGNFELKLPSRLFANHAALRSGRLEIHAWTERYSPAIAARFHGMTRNNWQEQFSVYAASLAGQRVYITIDLDCLRAEDAITNWENGLFAAADLGWAIHRLRESAQVVGGDICGAASPPVFSRLLPRLAAWWDHPAHPAALARQASSINVPSIRLLRRALTRSVAENASMAVRP